jgi:hypothetical protein
MLSLYLILFRLHLFHYYSFYTLYRFSISWVLHHFDYITSITLLFIIYTRQIFYFRIFTYSLIILHLLHYYLLFTLYRFSISWVLHHFDYITSITLLFTLDRFSTLGFLHILWLYYIYYITIYYLHSTDFLLYEFYIIFIFL